MPSPASTASRSLEGGNDASASGSGPQSSARATAEIIAITTRDDFLLEIGEALSGQTSVRPVDSLDTAIEQLGNTRRGVQLLAVDARDVGNLRADIERVNSQSPQTVILVFAAAEAEKQTAAAIKGTSVFAVLPIPVDKRKTAAVLEGATADAISRRAASGAQRSAQPQDLRFDRSSPITVEPAQTDAGHNTADSDSGGRKPMMVLVGGGLVVALIAAGAAWYFMREPAAPAATATNTAGAQASAALAPPSDADVVAEPAPVVDMPLVDGTVDELLEKARLAMRERRYTEPNGDNALLFYRSAAQADPANGEATDGLRRVAAVLSARFEEAMTAGRFDEASLALAHLKAATPDDANVNGLEGKLATAQITRMLADGNLDRAASLVKGAQQSGAVPEAQINRWRTEIGRRQDESRQRRLVELANESIREGRLTEPADDNAKIYLQQLKDLGPTAQAAQQRVSRDLGAAFMRKARESSQANRGPDVERWLAEARSAGVSNAEITSFQREVASARQRAAVAESDRLANLARDRIREGKLVEPANDSAAYYITSLQAADADHAYVAAGSRELATRLLDRASAAARDGRAAQSEADLTLARRWGADPKDIQAIQQASAAKKPPTRAASASTSSVASVPPEDLQAKLKRIRYSAPEYPERALSQRLSGSVTIEFTVNTKGEPQDVRVVSAEPAGTFDRAAINAIKRWRYEPLVIDNVPQDVPARTVIRFTLPE